MYDNPRQLLDQITLRHGPHDLLGRYFEIADDTARQCGVRLRLSTDFEGMIKLNQKNRATWPALPPTSDPAHSKLRIDSAFWLEGVDHSGETVVTYFARLFDFTHTNLVDEIRSLRIYYDDPVSHAAAGEMASINAKSLEVVRGRTTYGGGMWVRRDFRGAGFPKIMSRICTAYGYTRWNTAFSWGFVDPRAHALGLSRAYGPLEAVESLRVRLEGRGDKPKVLLWMDTKMMLADLANVIDKTMVSSPRQRNAHYETFASVAMPG